MNEICKIHAGDESILAEAIGFDNGQALLMPFSFGTRIPNDAQVESLGHPLHVPCGHGLLGRIINGIGTPIDGAGPLRNIQRVESRWHVPNAMTRNRIDTPLATGQRAIDAFLTMGVGQRMGLFAGSGVGKSTLLGEIAKYSTADYNVISLVGERGREVRPFIEDCLGEAGMSRSVVVAATSDETPLMRVRSVQTAATIAHHLREEGKSVLFFADSLTRLAMAQREIGLSLGEPPTARGYTPSVFQLLASTLEQLGNSDRGSITAIVTVLVDGDDMNDPIADCVRSIVDGHIVLTRDLAERGHFPAIDVSASISRTFNDVTTDQHQLCARKVRLAMATFRSNADLIRAGAYEPGSSAEIDNAIRLAPHIDAFLQQSTDFHTPQDATLRELAKLASEWKQAV
jgi:flagellum-specific ATP synthase